MERIIYDWYGDKHPIYAAIAMEAAKSYQLSISGPEHYEEAHKLISDVISCEWYYKSTAEFFNEPTLMDESESPSDDGLLRNILNTKERFKAYMKYDGSLSGKVYSVTKSEEEKKNCPNSIKEVLK